MVGRGFTNDQHGLRNPTPFAVTSSQDYQSNSPPARKKFQIRNVLEQSDSSRETIDFFDVPDDHHSRKLARHVTGHVDNVAHEGTAVPEHSGSSNFENATTTSRVNPAGDDVAHSMSDIGMKQTVSEPKTKRHFGSRDDDVRLSTMISSSIQLGFVVMILK